MPPVSAPMYAPGDRFVSTKDPSRFVVLQTFLADRGRRWLCTIPDAAVGQRTFTHLSEFTLRAVWKLVPPEGARSEWALGEARDLLTRLYDPGVPEDLLDAAAMDISKHLDAAFERGRASR